MVRLFKLYSAPGDPLPVAADGASTGTFADRIRRVILSGEVYFASPLDFNDPFDCLPNAACLSAPAEEQVLRKHFRTKLAMTPNVTRAMEDEYIRNLRNPDTARWSLRQVTSQFGVVCFTKRSDSPAMWAHYGSNHRGVCIEFELDERAGDHKFRPQPVKYSEVRPTVSASELTLPSKDWRLQWDVIERTLLTKADDWRYEKEWRLISTEPKIVRELGTDRVVSVTVGQRIYDVDRAAVSGFVAQRSKAVPIYMAHLHHHTYTIDRS